MQFVRKIRNTYTKTFTVKYLNFRTAENFAVIYLKFKKRGQTSGYFVKKMQMEYQTVKTLIRLLLEEQSDLVLHCLPTYLSKNFGSIYRSNRMFSKVYGIRSLSVIFCSVFCHQFSPSVFCYVCYYISSWAL